MNGLGAIVVIIYHEQTINTLGNDTVDVAFDDLDSRRAVLVESDYADRDLGTPRFLRMHCLLAYHCAKNDYSFDALQA